MYQAIADAGLAGTATATDDDPTRCIARDRPQRIVEYLAIASLAVLSCHTVEYLEF